MHDDLVEFVCSTHGECECLIEGYGGAAADSECACAPADDSRARTWCQWCGAPMFAIDLATGEPIG